MVEGGMKCVKYLLFAFNLLFMLTGIALAVIGGLVYKEYAKYSAAASSDFNAVAYIFIAVGCIVVVISFFACCGAIKENNCMVMTFAVLMGAIFLLELGCGIAAYVLQDDVKEVLEKSLNKTLVNYEMDSDDPVTRSMDIIQQDFECCGATNYTDWKYNAQYAQNNSVPDSCCEKYDDGCGFGQLKPEPEGIYERGCIDGMEQFFYDNLVLIGGVGIGLAFVQIAGIVLACCLAKSIRKEYEVV